MQRNHMTSQAVTKSYNVIYAPSLQTMSYIVEQDVSPTLAAVGITVIQKQ